MSQAAPIPAPTGGHPYDPSANVLMLVAAESKRQDDLRILTQEMSDRGAVYQQQIIEMRAKCAHEIGDMREQHHEDNSKAEAGRLDSIRQVDREDVAKTAAQANVAIATLAKQTTDLAATLSTQVETRASAAESRRSADMNEVNKRVSALELASSASAGKQTVADPMMEQLVAEMRAVRQAQALGAGKSAGMSGIGTLVLGVAAFFSALFGIGSAVVAIGTVIYSIATK